MITEIQQETSDIDWFFTSLNKIGFVMSGGGKLPDSVANLDDKLELISAFFRGLPESSGVIINSNLEAIKNTIITDNYLHDFIYMAKRGLFAFDKTVLNNFNETNYHLVAMPIKPLLTSTIPEDIFELIYNTVYTESLVDFNFLDVRDVI